MGKCQTLHKHCKTLLLGRAKTAALGVQTRQVLCCRITETTLHPSHIKGMMNIYYRAAAVRCRFALPLRYLCQCIVSHQRDRKLQAVCTAWVQRPGGPTCSGVVSVSRRAFPRSSVFSQYNNRAEVPTFRGNATLLGNMYKTKTIVPPACLTKSVSGFKTILALASAGMNVPPSVPPRFAHRHFA